MSCGSGIGSLAMQRVETPKRIKTNLARFSSNVFPRRRLGDFEVPDNALLNPWGIISNN